MNNDLNQFLTILGNDLTNIWVYLSTKVVSKKNDSLSAKQNRFFDFITIKSH